MVPVTMQAFKDELTKIGGEMQGFTRIGRKPISIERMLDRENEITELPEDFIHSSMQKAAQALVKMAVGVHVSGKTMATLGAGAGGMLVARHMNEDRKRGRAMRKAEEMARRQAAAQGY